MRDHPTAAALADAAVESCGFAFLSGASFFARYFAGPAWEDGLAEGVVTGRPEDLVAAALDALRVPGEHERAAGDRVAGIRRSDLNRVQRYVRKTWRGSLVDLQSKTLEQPFLEAVEGAMRTAARDKWGRDRFLEEVDRLALEYGSEGFRGSYAQTWHRTVVQNASFNRGTQLAYAADPTRRLFPFLVLRTVGDDRVRPNHAMLDGFVAPSGWDGWDRYAPPLGWNCRCRLVPVSVVIAKALGWIGKDFPNGRKHTHGKVIKGLRVVAGRDSGFDSPLQFLPGLSPY